MKNLATHRMPSVTELAQPSISVQCPGDLLSGWSMTIQPTPCAAGAPSSSRMHSCLSTAGVQFEIMSDSICMDRDLTTHPKSYPRVSLSRGTRLLGPLLGVRQTRLQRVPETALYECITISTWELWQRMHIPFLCALLDSDCCCSSACLQSRCDAVTVIRQRHEFPPIAYREEDPEDPGPGWQSMRTGAG